MRLPRDRGRVMRATRTSSAEFDNGWRIVLGAALAAGTGVALVFLNFSMFVLPLSQELGVSRGDLGSIQALIVTAALGAPLAGRAADRFGVRAVFITCTSVVACVHLLVAAFATSLLHMALSVAAVGFFGVGSTAVVLTRPINAHFRERRGLALGLMAVGVAFVGMAAPPLLQWLLQTNGWRACFIGLAALSVTIGIPAALLLLPKDRPTIGRDAAQKFAVPSDRSFLTERDFWLLTLSMITMSLATAGTVSQLVPMIADEGVGPKTAGLGLSLFAAGQFVGRLGGGWLLDRFDPRRVAVFLTLMPAIGFVVLLATQNMVAAALFAVAVIGVQQGAELDIFAYFVASRFDVSRYGSIYGAAVGFGWVGKVGGMVGMGQIYDYSGSYNLAQAAGVAALIISASLISMVKLPSSRLRA